MQQTWSLVDTSSVAQRGLVWVQVYRISRIGKHNLAQSKSVLNSSLHLKLLVELVSILTLVGSRCQFASINDPKMTLVPRFTLPQIQLQAVLNMLHS